MAGAILLILLFGLMGLCLLMLYRNNCVHDIQQRMNARWFECSKHILDELQNHQVMSLELHHQILEESHGFYELFERQPSYGEMMWPKHWGYWDYEYFCPAYEAELQKLTDHLMGLMAEA
jgi:hypothetical protein